MSLTGIQGDSFLVQLLKPESFSPVLAVVGVALTMFAKRDKKKDVGTILVGFAVLMFGMSAHERGGPSRWRTSPNSSRCSSCSAIPSSAC